MGNLTHDDLVSFEKLFPRRVRKNPEKNCCSSFGFAIADAFLSSLVIVEEYYTKYMHPYVDDYILTHFGMDKRSLEKRNRKLCVPVAESVMITFDNDDDDVVREDLTKYWNKTVRVSLMKYGNSFKKTISEILIEYYVDILEIEKIEEVKNYTNLRLYIKNNNDRKAHHFFDSGGSIDFINYFS